MNTPTLEEIAKAHHAICHCQTICDKCELVNYANYDMDECKLAFAYDVLTGKRNLDGSLVEEPAKETEVPAKLPSWCKVGQWCYLHNELVQITDIEEGVGVWTLSPTQEEPYLTDYTRIHEALKPVRFREYTFEEAKLLMDSYLGYVKDYGQYYERVYRVTFWKPEGVYINGHPYHHWDRLNTAVNGIPIGVPVVDDEAMKEVE